MAKNYAILRVGRKVHALGELAKVGAHNGRTRETPNADPQRADQNRRLAGSGDVVADAGRLLATVPKSGRRPGSVVAFEVVVSVSPEWWAGATDRQRDAWTAAQVPALESLFGAGNVAAADFHGDEATGHVHAVIVPIDRTPRKRGVQTRLNAKGIIGGPEGLTRHQDAYAARMAVLGLVRGLRGSAARHKPAKRWQAEQGAALETAERTAAGIVASARWRAEGEAAAVIVAAEIEAEGIRADAENQAGQDRRAAGEDRTRAAAMMEGARAVLDGRIVGADKAEDGRRRLHCAPTMPPEDRAALLVRIRPAWGDVWTFARRTLDRVAALIDPTSRAARGARNEHLRSFRPPQAPTPFTPSALRLPAVSRGRER